MFFTIHLRKVISALSLAASLSIVATAGGCVAEATPPEGHDVAPPADLPSPEGEAKLEDTAGGGNTCTRVCCLDMPTGGVKCVGVSCRQQCPWPYF
jgi:hypothetical protein